jgi:hypothetical protein
MCVFDMVRFLFKTQIIILLWGPEYNCYGSDVTCSILLMVQILLIAVLF